MERKNTTKEKETKDKKNKRFALRYARKYTERTKGDTQPEVIVRSYAPS
jgi:hypothetical protein